MDNKEKQVEVLTFRKGDLVATIATNGVRHVSQVGETCAEHGTLKRGIAYLCSRGYMLSVEDFKVV